MRAMSWGSFEPHIKDLYTCVGRKYWVNDCFVSGVGGLLQWFLSISCGRKSSLVCKTYLVWNCISESLDELHGFCSAASSSLMIHRLSLRLHICIKLQFNRTNSPLIKKPFSCHWDRRGPRLRAPLGERVYLSFMEAQSHVIVEKLWVYSSLRDALIAETIFRVADSSCNIFISKFRLRWWNILLLLIAIYAFNTCRPFQCNSSLILLERYYIQ